LTCRLEAILDPGANEEELTMQDQDKSKLARRDFLRVIGLGAGVAAAAASLMATEASATESASDAKKTRYNANAPDVKNYYRVNGYKVEG
jgi:nitrous oxide reductase